MVKTGVRAKAITKVAGRVILTTQQKAFVKHFLRNGCNQTRAAIAAGYPKANAHVQGHQLMQMDHVRAEVSKYLDAEGITPERIKIELAQIAFGESNDIADLGPFLDGSKSLSELRGDGVNTSLVKSANETQGEKTSSRRVEMYDRLAALEKLARIRKMIDGDQAAAPAAVTVRVDVLDVMRAMLNNIQVVAGSDCLSASAVRRLPAAAAEVIDVEVEEQAE